MSASVTVIVTKTPRNRLGLRVVLRRQESYKRLSGLKVFVEHSPTG